MLHFILIMTFWGATVQDGVGIGGPASIVANFAAKDTCQAAAAEMTKELTAKRYSAITATCFPTEDAK